MKEEKDKDGGLEFTFYDEKKIPYQKIPLCIFIRELLDEEKEQHENE